jgi:hypothetical protein
MAGSHPASIGFWINRVVVIHHRRGLNLLSVWPQWLFEPVSGDATISNSIWSLSAVFALGLAEI